MIDITSPSEIWKPNPKQEEFLSLPDSIFEALYGGAAFGGKTESLMMLPICKEFIQYPRFKGLLLRRTYPELERELILRSHYFYKQAGGNYNDQKKRFQFSSGAIIQFGHVKDEKDMRDYDTAEYNYIGFDEVTSFTQTIYEYLTFTRCRSSDDNLPAFVRSGTNPGNIGHNYFRKRFIDPCKEGGTVLRERRVIDGEEKQLLRIFIKALISDNEVGNKNDPSYKVRLEMMSNEAEKAAKLYGDWYTFEGQVFEDFRDSNDRRRFSDEPENAINVVNKFDVPYYWPLILAIDWGFSAYNVVGFYRINPNPTSKFPAKIYKTDEMYWKKTKISVWTSDLVRKLQNSNLSPKIIAVDPSAWQNRGESETIIQQIQEGLQDYIIEKADNDRIGGKSLLQEYIRWKSREAIESNLEYSEELANRISRTQGPKAYQEYLISCNKREMDTFLPKFQIFSNCEKTIECISSCVYDKVRTEDVAEFDGDDFYDETRYGLKACISYLDSGRNEFERETKLSKIEQSFEKTRNHTEWHRKMSEFNNSKSVMQFRTTRFGRMRRMLSR